MSDRVRTPFDALIPGMPPAVRLSNEEAASNVVAFPKPDVPSLTWSGGSASTRPRWRCEIHGDLYGDQDHVMFIATVQGEQRSYCIACIVDLLDRIGLRNLPRVESGGSQDG